MSHARWTTLTFLVMYLSPLKPKYCAGHNSHTVRDNLIIVGGTYIWSSMSVACKKDNSSFVIFLVISPERISKPNSYVLYNFLIV